MTQVCTNFLRLPSREDAFSSKRYAEKESRGGFPLRRVGKGDTGRR